MRDLAPGSAREISPRYLIAFHHEVSQPGLGIEFPGDHAVPPVIHRDPPEHWLLFLVRGCRLPQPFREGPALLFHAEPDGILRTFLGAVDPLEGVSAAVGTAVLVDQPYFR